MKGKPDIKRLIQSIQNHGDVVVKELYRAFYYQRQGWMEIDEEDVNTMSNYLKQRRKEHELKWP